jgi:hypothetical protein
LTIYIANIYSLISSAAPKNLVPEVKCDPYRTFSPGLLLSTLAKKEEKIQEKKKQKRTLPENLEHMRTRPSIQTSDTRIEKRE